MFEQKENKKQLEGVNKARLQHGLTPIVKKMKVCLRCEFDFLSEGPQNRMCSRCRAYTGSVLKGE